MKGKIYFFHKKILREREFDIPLYLDEELLKPVWYEHPKYKNLVDVVAIRIFQKPVTEDAQDDLIIYQPIGEEAEWKKWKTGDKLTVLGYPYGLQSTPGAIWITGHIATDPNFNYIVDGEPIDAFLIDSRTRFGQSGSPVICRFNPGEDSVEWKGVKLTPIGYMDFFLGVYSGRINADSDLGYVWKPSIIREIVNEIESSL